MIIRGLLLAACVAIAGAGAAQQAAVSAAPGKTVEGATPDRVAQVEACQGRKFETMVEIDPARNRSTKVKLCANPGSSDADWAKTLEAAIAQMEQRDMPAGAKDKLIAELKAELAKFAPTKPAIAAGPPLFIGKEAEPSDGLIAPAERYETSNLPPLPDRKVAAATGTGTKPNPARPMSIRIKCLERGESGAGQTCVFFEAGTVLAVSAVNGLEQGGLLRFRRKGEARGEVNLAPMQAGQLARVRLPGELCRGISYSKVEIELLHPKSAGTASARFGPYGLRC